ncbi:tRNA (N6-isopentenyl adenosine(37)-C2)-methylthiotransferase MiaB [candidate division WOR-3 bacterium]|uniref:tRNA-2-methylthio-N(6)-dimethylallyladenosine synthase n=1 Tax=candidate division WOR-3 bacterium TaxID=2052148 RepID=A0A937XF10_UNCW3|nr:tRNA (N6-isopentenyl adenosine(37)-C2)-methylthiotransferase MiaB [candidate division WOR-3 bacterium]
MPKFYLQTYGCQMNVCESGVVRRVLTDAGLAETADERDADVLLMMTCSVRSHAEQRALGRLGSFRALRSEQKDRVVGVLGCMAQRFAEALITDHHADIVVGPDEYLRLPKLIADVQAGGAGTVATRQTNECYDTITPQPGSSVSAFVTVMRGCDNYCTYCIVPYVKGHERSRPLASVLAEAERNVSEGVKEITLLGQNVLAYRDGGNRFPDLLAAVASALPQTRIRFLTSHPRDLNSRLLDTMRRLPNVCPSLHLPVQSGSDAILERMNRGYTRDEYLARIALCRQYLPGVSLATDVLVGFPSETEADFKATLDLIEEVRFDSAYLFRFSMRPGTRAAEFEPKISEADAGRRLSRLIEVQNRITAERNRDMLNKEFELLIEGPSPRDSGWLGRTVTNKVVIVKGSCAPGDTVRCRITRINGWTPVAEVLARAEAAC